MKKKKRKQWDPDTSEKMCSVEEGQPGIDDFSC